MTLTRLFTLTAVALATLQVSTTPLRAETQALTGGIALAPIQHENASLTVAGPTGETRYTPEMLEAMAPHRMTTITPWRRQPAMFDGVLLTDVLAANGLDQEDAIRVIAENGYAVEIERRVWETWPVLIATRVNGEAHSKRERGPLQFVLPMSQDAQSGTGRMTSNWVWMAERIELVD